jgi:hypothetical protein
MIGTVCLREELSYTAIDVDFTDKNAHRNIIINDDFGAIMCSIGHSGMLLASKGTDTGMEDEEMDDFISPEDDEDVEMAGADNEEKKRKRHAHIQFKAFNTYKNIKDWHFALKNGEQVECLALGSGWAAAATDYGYIRVFSSEGVQRTIICQGTPFVTMAGYENLLAVVYHAGPAVYGCQALKLKIFDMTPTGN